MSVQKSRLLSSEGVASKRNFFEGSAPSKAEPAALRKVRWGCFEWGHPRLGDTAFGANVPSWDTSWDRWVPGLSLGTGTLRVPAESWDLRSWDGAKVWAGLSLRVPGTGLGDVRAEGELLL